MIDSDGCHTRTEDTTSGRGTTPHHHCPSRLVPPSSGSPLSLSSPPPPTLFITFREPSKGAWSFTFFFFTVKLKLEAIRYAQSNMQIIAARLIEVEADLNVLGAQILDFDQ